jgi:glutaredoxin 3
MIVIYSINGCVFCEKAKRLAEDYKLSYVEHKIDENQAKRQELLEMIPDVKTVPQIWWNDRHIGGYTEFVSEVENTINNYGHGKL